MGNSFASAINECMAEDRIPWSFAGMFIRISSLESRNNLSSLCIENLYGGVCLSSTLKFSMPTQAARKKYDFLMSERISACGQLSAYR